VIFRLFVYYVFKQLARALKVAVTQSRPSVSSVYYVYVTVRVDSPAASAESAYVTVALSPYVAAT